MNKHIETLLTSIIENAKSQADAHIDTPTYDNQDTQKLVRAIVNGEGLRPSRSSANVQSDTSHLGTASNSASSTHVANRQPMGMVPQQRR